MDLPSKSFDDYRADGDSDYTDCEEEDEDDSHINHGILMLYQVQCFASKYWISFFSLPLPPSTQQAFIISNCDRENPQIFLELFFTDSRNSVINKEYIL